ncbi:TetR/AcrR family transcriptional regulator [Plantibacter sp. RU18]|uniref:TetR/AcrR family transcriptional regulator n=1 Tax=Plantibacter sp. RU18 TaxID=3158143 RepID=UPI003D363A9A
MSEPAAATPKTPHVGRREAKALRRTALLRAAASLFAEHGFTDVSMEDLGMAVGMSGPAVYRHFPSKQAVLAALLIDVSQDLLDGGAAEVDRAPDSELALRALVGFHVAFALDRRDVIRVQDHDLDSLTPEDSRTVRTLQRRYVERWVDVLSDLHPGTPTPQLRIRAHAGFGLINSTPHSAALRADREDTLERQAVRTTLEQMALAALLAR